MSSPRNITCYSSPRNITCYNHTILWMWREKKVPSATTNNALYTSRFRKNVSKYYFFHRRKKNKISISDDEQLTSRSNKTLSIFCVSFTIAAWLNCLRLWNVGTHTSPPPPCQESTPPPLSPYTHNTRMHHQHHLHICSTQTRTHTHITTNTRSFAAIKLSCTVQICQQKCPTFSKWQERQQNKMVNPWP